MNLPVSLAAEADRIRESRRFVMTLPVTVRFDSAEHGANLFCSDISASGAFLSADVLLTEGTDMWCEIALPDGYPLRTAARVVRVIATTEAPRRSGMGVAFAELDADARDRIARLALDAG